MKLKILNSLQNILKLQKLKIEVDTNITIDYIKIKEAEQILQNKVNTNKIDLAENEI